MKARQVFAKDSTDGRAHGSEHVFVILEDGSLHERFSDDEPGKWSEIPLPKREQDEPPRSRKK
jgi:hypothetical protein